MASFSLPKLAATMVALFLIGTLASSFGEASRNGPKEMELRAKVIIEENLVNGKPKMVIQEESIRFVQPKQEVLKSVVDQKGLKCVGLGEVCDEALSINCCSPYTCTNSLLPGLCTLE